MILTFPSQYIFTPSNALSILKHFQLTTKSFCSNLFKPVGNPGPCVFLLLCALCVCAFLGWPALAVDPQPGLGRQRLVACPLEDRVRSRGRAWGREAPLWAIYLGRSGMLTECCKERGACQGCGLSPQIPGELGVGEGGGHCVVEDCPRDYWEASFCSD